MLYCAQCFEASRRRKASEFGAFQLPYSMLCRYRPARRGDEIIDHARDLSAFSLIPVWRRMVERADVKVDVSVAEVPEAAGDKAGERLLHLGRGPGDERRHVGHRHRDVVSQGLAFGALGLRDRVADFPESVSLGFV